MDVQPKFVPKFRLALLLGLLSIFYGEVYAGSSFLWMFDAWGLLITFPLYMFHSLFYLNMAQRTKRITISQLYLWGMLFALYEAPITKVLFSTYPSATAAWPAWGFFFGTGIATMEFMVPVFFWHPVMSFMMPIFTLEIFIQSATKNPADIITSHRPLLEWNGNSKFLFIFITIICSAPMAINNYSKGTNPDIVLLASILLILFMKAITPLKIADVKMTEFRLGNKGFGFVIFYLIILYSLAIPLIPNVSYTFALSKYPSNFLNGIISIIVVAMAILVLLRISKPNPLLTPATTIETSLTPSAPESGKMMTTRHLYSLWLFMAILIGVWSLIPQITNVLFFLFFGIGLPVLGVAVLIVMLINLFRQNPISFKNIGILFVIGFLIFIFSYSKLHPST